MVPAALYAASPTQPPTQIAFSSTFSNPRHLTQAFYKAHLPPIVEAGVRGFKGFLIESGVEEFPAVSQEDIQLAMKTLKDIPTTTLMFHAEMIPRLSLYRSQNECSLGVLRPDRLLARQRAIFQVTPQTCAVSSRGPDSCFQRHDQCSCQLRLHVGSTVHQQSNPSAGPTLRVIWNHPQRLDLCGLAGADDGKWCLFPGSCLCYGPAASCGAHPPKPRQSTSIVTHIIWSRCLGDICTRCHGGRCDWALRDSHPSTTESCWSWLRAWADSHRPSTTKSSWSWLRAWADSHRPSTTKSCWCHGSPPGQIRTVCLRPNHVRPGSWLWEERRPNHVGLIYSLERPTS